MRFSVQVEADRRQHRIPFRRLSGTGKSGESCQVDGQQGTRLYLLHTTDWSFVSLSDIFSLAIFLSVRCDRLRPIDIEFMRKLHHKVNLIPVIAKADTLTDDEIVAFKQRVSATLRLPPVKCDRLS
jgi:hypothetical protein